MSSRILPRLQCSGRPQGTTLGTKGVRGRLTIILWGLGGHALHCSSLTPGSEKIGWALARRPIPTKAETEAEVFLAAKSQLANTQLIRKSLEQDPASFSIPSLPRKRFNHTLDTKKKRDFVCTGCDTLSSLNAYQSSAASRNLMTSHASNLNSFEV